MQIETTMKNYLTPMRMAHIRKTPPTNAAEEIEKEEPTYTLGGNVNWPLWDRVRIYLIK